MKMRVINNKVIKFRKYSVIGSNDIKYISWDRVFERYAIIGSIDMRCLKDGAKKYLFINELY